MLLNNRHGSVDSDAYRYGFQGQERDDEVKGEGNSYNYTYRMHDPRLGRFFAVDPLAPSYPNYTPYSFSANKVISEIEREGLESTFYLFGFQRYRGRVVPALLIYHELSQKAPRWLQKEMGGEKNYVFGSDGHWHKIPNSVMNGSLYTLGDSPNEIMRSFNDMEKISEAENRMLISLINMETIGNDFSTAFYTLYGAPVVTNRLGRNISRTVKETAAISGKGSKLKIFRRISDRHYGSKVSNKTVAKTKNTVVANDVDVAADLSEINKGNYIKRDGLMTLENGRNYVRAGKDGLEIVPHSGPGVFTADRGVFKGLGILNTHGVVEAQKLMYRSGLSRGTIRKAYRLFYKVNRVPKP